ncbi:myelin-associated glycoprotein-like [Carassius gibelio]|uniref:myelin-associated glycoprotein-like n=1 Tax=Carassius gibelio TaxID=101364 RepID=UPI0022795EA0|nr:myelin-associated glycoprotein-like [Carassius gibelio]
MKCTVLVFWTLLWLLYSSMSSPLRTPMAGNQFTSFIFIGFVLGQAHSADDTYSSVMPRTVTALAGSCVQIPCTFNISNFEDKCKRAESNNGIWLKNQSQYASKYSFVAFNCSEDFIRGFSDIKITGDFNKRNCSTVFYNIMMNHSGHYYFRLEIDPNVFRTTFNPNTADSSDSSKTVKIIVRDSPQPPEFNPSELPYVMEESTVNLSCSAEAPCPTQRPTISWSNIPESASITKQLLEKPDKTVFSYVTFKASYTDHKKNITCTATYPRNTHDASSAVTTLLRVLFPPKETHIIITPSVGTNVTLTCKSKASPSNNLNYTWYKRGQEMPIAWEKKINLSRTHSQESYFCIAQNKHGKQASKDFQFKDDRQSEFSHLVIYGCTGGLLAFVLLSAGFFYCMRTKASRQGHVTGKDQAEGKNRDMMAIYVNNDIVISKNGEKKGTDDLHYSEIDFSKLQTGHKTREHPNNGPVTEYAVVQMIERKRQINSDQQMDQLYAEVQKK